MSYNSQIYDLSQLAGPSPWPSAPVDVWEDWYKRLQTEEELLNTGDVPSNEYELDGLAKVRTAMTHAEHKIFYARKLAEEKLQDEKDWDDIQALIDEQHEEQHCKVSKIEERAARMTSEVEDLLLDGLPGAGNDPQDDLKSSTPSWYPDTGHCSEIKIDFPASYLNYTDGPRFKEVTYNLNRGGQCVPTAPEVGKGMYTHVPDGTLFAGLKLPAWGSQHGTRETREAWVARDIIGHGVLIRVKRIATPKPIPGTLHTPLDETEHELSNLALKFYNEVYEFPNELTGNHFRYEWLFALVKSYDAPSGKHSLEFKFDDVPITGICVDLEKCMFQEWTRPDLRALKAKNIL
ncbi:MAG: hypothetical protein CL699_07765 [Chloroflexi bacterium]|nr:hypothetical protein [Chloroflexota bacterium]